MHLSQKQKLILAIVIFMIAGYILYSTFGTSKSSGTTSKVSVSGLETATTTENQDIIDLANKFDQIIMNNDLFSSALFKNLKDLETPLSAEDSGRPNPFAAIGNDTGTSVTVSTTTQVSQTMVMPAKKKTP